MAKEGVLRPRRGWKGVGGEGKGEGERALRPGDEGRPKIEASVCRVGGVKRVKALRASSHPLPRPAARHRPTPSPTQESWVEKKKNKKNEPFWTVLSKETDKTRKREVVSCAAFFIIILVVFLFP